jgi:hypothetical protein
VVELLVRMRARRLAGVVVAAAAACLLVVAAPSSANGSSVTPSVRRAIDVTLDRFVLDAVERHDPAAAWELAGPGLRAGTTRADWVAGRLPVYPFQARDHNFAGWVPSFVTPRQVGFDLLLQPPRGAKTGAIAFTVTMRLIRGRWLVDYWVPAATFSAAGARPQIQGPGDITAPSQRASNSSSHGALGAIWLLVPVAVVSLAVVFLLGFAVVAWRKGPGTRYVPGRRTRRPLPPLPGTDQRSR